jgi:hypothetical protein
MTCLYAPYTLAFLDDVPRTLEVLDNAINVVFLFDIGVNLLSAYQDENFDMVDDHSVSFTHFQHHN